MLLNNPHLQPPNFTRGETTWFSFCGALNRRLRIAFNPAKKLSRFVLEYFKSIKWQLDIITDFA